MWSHTIQSSKSNKAPAVSGRSVKVNDSSTKGTGADTRQDEDMTQEFEADGFSKTARVRASKKPLTVAKAPTLGRTTSTKGEEPATPTDSPRLGMEKRLPKGASTPAIKGGSSARAPRAGTPIQPSSIVAKAKVPPLSSRTKTPTQASGTSRAGSPAQGRPVVRSSKATEVTEGRANTDKRLSKARNSALLAGKIQEEEPLDNEPKEAATEVKDDAGANHNADGILEDRSREDVEVVGRFPSERRPEAENNVSDQHQEEQANRKDREANDELNREITLRNDTIKSLRKELQCLRSTQEHRGEGPDLEATAQVKSLQSELDSVRSTLVDLDDTHRSTLEKHDSLLRSRDKIIQNLSSEAQELREKLECNDRADDQDDSDHQKKPERIDQKQQLVENEIVLPSKDDEIRSLSEIVQDLRKQLEAADTARAKEIYDELLKSKDEKIESVSGVVQDLRGEIKAAKPAGKQKHDNQLLRSRDEEIQSLKDTVQGLRDKFEATDQVKEQEVSHSVMSLRYEFQDLQNKHKRKIEDLEAAAFKRAEALQFEYDELLCSRDQEIKDMAGMTQDLQNEIETAREGQRKELDDAITNYQGQIEATRIQYDRELDSVKLKHAHELETVRAGHQDTDSKHQSTLQEMIRKHKSELESVRADQQVAETSQQELRETRRKHEKALESVKVEVQDEVRDEMARLELEIEDASTRHQHEIENMEEKVREQIGENAKSHAQALRDAALAHKEELEQAGADYARKVEAANRESNIAFEKEVQRHESELEEAKTKYQRELADVERLRGQGSDDVSQEHENQLRIIAEKYQQELGEAARRLEDQVSRHEHELQEAEAHLDEVKTQAELYHRELEETRSNYELFESENRIQGQKLQDWATKHDKELEIVSNKYRDTMGQANAKLDRLVEATARRKQEHQDRMTEKEREIKQVRDDLVAVRSEATSLKATIEEMKLSRSDADEDSNRVHQQELTEMSSRYEQDLNHLHTEIEAAAAEVASYKIALKESDAQRSEAVGGAVRSHEQLLRDATLRHEEAVSRLRHEYDNVTEEMDTLKHKLRDLEQEGEGVVGEIASLRDTVKDIDLAKEQAEIDNTLLKNKLELSDREKVRLKDTINALRRDIDGLQAQIAHSAEDFDRERRVAAVEVALLKDKKDLADRESRQNTDIITALRKDVERIQAQLADASADLARERDEAVVEIALLKDKLELADLQKQSASEDTSLSQNELNVEIALLKDKLELADLQSQQDKKAITALQGELQAHNTKVPDPAPYVHHQLREELAMLARHHATNVADVAALKASILAEREVREEGWRNRAESRERIAKEMQGIGAELNGIVGAN